MQSECALRISSRKLTQQRVAPRSWGLETCVAVDYKNHEGPNEVEKHNSFNPIQQPTRGYCGQIVKPIFAGVSLCLWNMQDLTGSDTI